MKFPHFILINLLALSPLASWASGRTVMCDEPMGPRLDYFTSNTANLQNNQFLVGRDQMTGVHVRIVFSDNNQDVSFAVGDMTQLQSMPEANNMKVMSSTKDQISFIGNINEAPVLATFYPAMNVLIYSQQSMWPGDSFAGARAMMFYARCHDVTPAASTTTPAGAATTAPTQQQPTAQQVQGLAVPPQAVPPVQNSAAAPEAITAPASTPQ